MTTFFLNTLALGTILTGIFSITSKNPVISVIFLISTFVQAAGYLIFIGVNFIGISYIVIYVGAIAVLFLFVIMMINIKLTDILDSGNQYTKNLPLAVTIASIFLYIIYNILSYNLYNVVSLQFLINKLSLINNSFNSVISSMSINPIFIDQINTYNLEINTIYDTIFSNYSQIAILGHNLYTNGAILLIVLSFILLLAMFAIIVIISNKNND